MKQIKLPKPDLSALGRDVLLKMAARCLELESRVELSLLEQNKPAEEQTIPTCLFCDLIIGEGQRAIAATSGAIICERCVMRANGELAGRSGTLIGFRAEDGDAVEEVEVCGEACPEYPRCACGNVALDPKRAVHDDARRMAPCPTFPGCGCSNLDACRRFGS